MKDNLIEHITSPLWWASALVGFAAMAYGWYEVVLAFLAANAGTWFGAGTALFGLALPNLGLISPETGALAMGVIALAFVAFKARSLWRRAKARFGWGD